MHKERYSDFFELNDPDPKHRIASYALKHGYEQILATGIDYDFSIRLDADNHINDEFFDLMNDSNLIFPDAIRLFLEKVSLNVDGKSS